MQYCTVQEVYFYLVVFLRVYIVYIALVNIPTKPLKSLANTSENETLENSVSIKAASETPNSEEKFRIGESWQHPL